MISDELRNYFHNMFKEIDPNIILDDDQINAVINDDPAVLILTGAGTGKTTTMVAKVKYLVDIKHVDPSKIVVVSYTRRAVEELRNLINDQFDINTDVTTFHSLAYKYIRRLFHNKMCEVVDYNFKEKVFYDYIEKLYKEERINQLIDNFKKSEFEKFLNNKGDENDIIVYFKYSNYFLTNYKKYNDYESFFKDYKEYRIETAEQKDGITQEIEKWIYRQYSADEKDKGILTIKGDYVKSRGEAVIANFLYKHGINYSYEKIYENLVEDRKIYKPDFTLNLEGENVYLEYFGMNSTSYNRIKNMKINFHNRNNNKFIYIDRMNMKEIESTLDSKLKEQGFVYKDRSDEEIYNHILEHNKLSPINDLKKLFYNILENIKGNVNRNNYQIIIKNYINTLPNSLQPLAMKQFELFNEFYIYYTERLYKPDIYTFDFADLLYYVNKYISDRKYLNDLTQYEYIIIDEYQDISDGEYQLTKKTADRFNSKVYAVGDDWQSIYAFRGSNIGYSINFNKYFYNPTTFFIRNVYRNSQELVDISSEFIMQNPYQIHKELISKKHLRDPIRFIEYNDKIDDNLYDDRIEYQTLKKLISKIHEKNPDHSILILARNNNMINKCFYDSEFIKAGDNRIKIRSIEDIELEGMTIHKSKGLTYDEVIIIGMNQDFPNENHYEHWILSLFKNKPIDKDYKDSEERRLFYVALTRTKNYVYILYNCNEEHRSIFVDQIKEICEENNN